MSTSMTEFQALEQRRRLLLDELKNTQNAIQKGQMGNFDIHHPERSPGWPRYQFQEFPKVLYHPVQLDPQRELARDSVLRRNRANPNAAPLDVPESKPLLCTVNSKEEQEAAEKQGFIAAPVYLQPKDDERKNLDPLAMDPEELAAVAGTRRKR